jgi:hypothetical protein
MYIPAGALVTNLSVHFKWARENALAWVTTLDTAKPTEGAHVTVQDCHGAVLATGVTDAQGLARFTGLPDADHAPSCTDAHRFEGFDDLDYRDYYAAKALTDLDGGLLIVAETTGDMSFVHTVLAARHRAVALQPAVGALGRAEPRPHHSRSLPLPRRRHRAHETRAARPDTERLRPGRGRREAGESRHPPSRQQRELRAPDQVGRQGDR